MRLELRSQRNPHFRLLKQVTKVSELAEVEKEKQEWESREQIEQKQKCENKEQEIKFRRYNELKDEKIYIVTNLRDRLQESLEFYTFQKVTINPNAVWQAQSTSKPKQFVLLNKTLAPQLD